MEISSGTSSGIVLNEQTLYVLDGGIVISTWLRNGGLLFVEDGGIASGTKISNGGFMWVHDGGTASTTTVSGGGKLSVDAGGTASTTTVLNGGNLEVHAGGVLKDAVIYQGGWFDAEDGAEVSNVVFSEWELSDDTFGGMGSGLIASNCKVLNDGELNVYAGGTASGTNISNGGYMWVHDGGTASTTTVSGGGKLSVEAGGVATDITQEVGGILEVTLTRNGASTKMTGTNASGSFALEKGKANSFILYKDGSMQVSAGCTATTTTVSSGGMLEVHEGGTASNTTVSSGGSVYVGYGGLLKDAVIYQGGWLDDHGALSNVVYSGWKLAGDGDSFLAVYSGYIASNTMVSDGGCLHVWSDGVANTTTISNGGTLYVEPGAVLKDAFIYEDTIVSLSEEASISNIVYQSWDLKDDVNLTVSSGFTASEAKVSSGGLLHISSGGSTTGTTISYSGRQYVSGGGVASGAKISGYSGAYIYYGREDVCSGGRAVDTTVYLYGLQTVSSGGVASGTVVSSGGSQNLYEGDAVGTVLCGGSQDVHAGAEAYGTVVSSGGSQKVDNKSVASGTTILKGGVQTVTSNYTYPNQVLPGLAIGTVISSGGRQIVSSGGMASGTTVSSGGSMLMDAQSTAEDTTVLSGGYASGFSLAPGQNVNMEVAANTFVSGSYSDGGTFSMQNGVASGFVLYSGGWQAVLAGGTASSTVVSSGGLQTVSAGGSAKGTTVSSGGTLSLLDGASAGGFITLEGTMAVNGAVVFADDTCVMLDVSNRSESDGHMVTGFTEHGNINWSLNAPDSTRLGSYRLIEDFEELDGICIAIVGSTVRVNESVQYCGQWYALSAEDGLCLTVAAEDPLFDDPEPITVSASDARLNTPVSVDLPGGVTVTDEMLLNVGEYDIPWGTISLSDGKLVFTQKTAYRHAAGADSASETYQIGVTNKFGNDAMLNVTVNIADTAPTLSVAAPGASVPSGTAKSGTWSWDFGGDAMETVTVNGKILPVTLSTDSTDVSGTYGTLTVKANGTYSYKADPNAAGTDTFTFNISDADGDSASATLKVTVIDKTAPTVTKITGKTSAIGAVMQFSEKMDAATLKSALKATFTGTGATATPTAVKETDAANHAYSATFAATNYVGAYTLTLGTGAKDAAGNALARAVTSSVAAMTVTGRTIASGACQDICSGGTASNVAVTQNGVQTVYDGGVVSKGAVGTGAAQHISGGAAYGTQINARGAQRVSAGLASGTVIKSGGSQIVSSGGIASAAVVSSGGIQHIRTGGSAAAATVGKGGAQYVSNGGKSLGTTVASAGTIQVCKGGTTSALTVRAGGTADLYGGSMRGTNTFSGATINVCSAGVKINAIKANAATLLNFDVSKVAPGAEVMLTESVRQSLSCTFAVTTNGFDQERGSYALSSNLEIASGASFTIKTSSESQALTLGSSLAQNGLEYTLSSSDGKVTLGIALKKAEICVGNSGSNNIFGDRDNDIFYGGKGNDKIFGVHGHDVAVYDATDWGENTIAATEGKMTLLFAGMKDGDLKMVRSGSYMLISKKADARQNIVVEGWNDATHKVVYGDALTKFTAYLNAASPTTAQTNAARTEVWQKAGLASA